MPRFFIKPLSEVYIYTPDAGIFEVEALVIVFTVFCNSAGLAFKFAYIVFVLENSFMQVLCFADIYV